MLLSNPITLEKFSSLFACICYNLLPLSYTLDSIASIFILGIVAEFSTEVMPVGFLRPTTVTDN